jgi:hypothetical protein
MYTPARQIATNRRCPGLGVVFGIVVFFACGSTASLACGWWGDAEQREAAVAVVVGPDGLVTTAREAGVAHLDDLVRMADRFRTGDRLPRSAPDAFRLYRLAATQGHVGAQYNLARMYERGLGVARDDTEAARWYRQSADAGDVHAQHHLSEMYRDGRGVTRDMTAAARWLRASAEGGHSEVFAELASTYWHGRGVPRDPRNAYLWWRRAELAGDREAADRARAAKALIDDPSALASIEREAKASSRRAQ